MSYDLGPIWAASLCIYQEFVTICERHQLRWFASYGTALGAVRHHGFIPWDDDIDINMPRPDYERFLELAVHELPSYLKLRTRKTDPSFQLRFSKICDERREVLNGLTEQSGFLVDELSLDIFPIDGVPSSLIGFYIWKLRLALVKAMSLSLSLRLGRFCSPIGIRWYVGRLARLFIFRSLTMEQYRTWQEKIETKYDYDRSHMVGDLSTGAGLLAMRTKKNVYGNAVFLPFANTQVPVPEDYHSYLRAEFGDYMKLPPEGERKPLHYHPRIG